MFSGIIVTVICLYRELFMFFVFFLNSLLLLEFSGCVTCVTVSDVKNEIGESILGSCQAYNVLFLQYFFWKRHGSISSDMD